MRTFRVDVITPAGESVSVAVPAGARLQPNLVVRLRKCVHCDEFFVPTSNTHRYADESHKTDAKNEREKAAGWPAMRALRRRRIRARQAGSGAS